MIGDLRFSTERRLDSIDLDQLVAAAALQTRVDRKYLLGAAEADRVLRTLADSEPEAKVLEIDGEREFGYESVYFDTPDLLSFRMAATARRRRFKLRTRSYLDSGDTFLELKTRGARSATVKDRMPYEPERRDVLTPHARDYADSGLAEIGIADADTLELQPTLITRYSRTTIYQPRSGSRATVDTDLRWESDGGEVLSRPRLVIIETKSGSRTSETDRILWSLGHRPATVSKYGTGLAAIRHLTANKWNRVLRRYFDAEMPLSRQLSAHTSAAAVQPRHPITARPATAVA
ncbi:polyphosphate polymerase domain-containing protein [Naasia lichenicola]|uniref:Polyphosphate polymerase domain-containing protein n=1 Tax=Naasia lichenicola TaxID=2565933 RepID=A0A4S4FU50_9MICO|nr:polyphosphate polymerase domain-containing protein [Naasia lichenicola]THG33522.1 polyphosphate polymerase domain-containing protein [Naasia lichenicola]